LAQDSVLLLCLVQGREALSSLLLLAYFHNNVGLQFYD